MPNYEEKILNQLEKLGVEINDGTQDVQEVEAYDINLDKPVCPVCHKRLKVKHKNISTDSFVAESRILKENKIVDYLQQKVYDIALSIYEDEIKDNEPETDFQGNVTDEYLERFKYSSPELRKAVRRAATKLAYELKEEGLEINTWRCEMEILDALKCFSRK